MKNYIVVGFVLGLMCLLAYRSQYSMERKAPVKALSFTMEMNSAHLENFVKKCVDGVLKKLVEKGFIKQEEDSEGSESASVSESYESEYAYKYASKGINLVPGAQVIVLADIMEILNQQLAEDAWIATLSSNDRSLLKITLKNMMFSVFMSLFSEPQFFDWCECISPAKRITLAINVVNDVCRNYKPAERLRYTGSLLQDYIIVQELVVRGFKTMTINLIDPGYFSPAEMKNLEKFAKDPQERVHAKYLEKLAKKIDEFWTSIEEQEKQYESSSSSGDASSTVSSESSSEEWEYELDKFVNSVALQEFKNRIQKPGTDIEVVVWENTYDYIDRAKQYPAWRSDVLLLIDPEKGYFIQPSYPSLANVVKITQRGQEEDATFVFAPLHAKAKVHACDGSPVYGLVSSFAAGTHKEGSALMAAIVEHFYENEDVSLQYIVNLYLLLQDMMYECLADIQKAVVYSGKERVDKINPIAYRQRDVAEEQAREICFWEAETVPE